MDSLWKVAYDELHGLVEQKAKGLESRLKRADQTSLLLSAREELDKLSAAKKNAEKLNKDFFEYASFQDDINRVSGLENLFDKKLEQGAESLVKSFQKQYKEKIKVKELAVIENKKNDLYHICNEYSMLAKAGFLGKNEARFAKSEARLAKSKSKVLANQKISRFAFFYENVKSADERLSALAQSYFKSESKAQLKVILNQAKILVKDYDAAIKAHAPFFRSKSNPYNCKMNIANVSSFISKVSDAIGSFDELSGIRETILKRIRINEGYIRKLNEHKDDADVAKYFTKVELENVSDKMVISAKHINEPLKKMIDDYDASARAVEKEKKKFRSYISSELESVAKKKEYATLEQAFDALRAKKRKIERLSGFAAVVDDEMLNGKNSLIRRSSDFIAEENDSLDDIFEQRKSIYDDVSLLGKGLIAGLTPLKYHVEKKNHYLVEAVSEYENIFKKIHDSKKKEVATAVAMLPVRKQADYDAVYNLPLHIEGMGLPRNDDYFSLRHALLGMWDKNWIDRFARFESEVKKLKTTKEMDDVDYLKRMSYFIEQSTTKGMILMEIEKKKENSLKVTSAISALNNYIVKSEAMALASQSVQVAYANIKSRSLLPDRAAAASA